MATYILSNDIQTNINDKHLEIFCIIWLDANHKESRDTEQKLRSIINYLKKFQDVEQCQQYIKQRSKNDRLIIIVSGQLGREIVPSIHKLRQVISIYVYCMDKKINEKWSSQFLKVKAVVTKLDELVSRITADDKILKKVEEPLSFSTFTTNSGGEDKSTMALNGQFVFNQVLIDSLLKLKSTDTDRKELINICKTEYKGNLTELDNLREFCEDYSSDKALWWYTKESFFYKILNGSLRGQEIHMIFLFRAFILDIHRQLQLYQFKHPITVYRSQMISKDELKTLKERIGQFISINSFFSTSTDYDQALSFLRVSDDLERVLFKINADPKMVTTKPFAEISKYSYFTTELEVLFMLGSIFRLQSIKRDDDKEVWIIRMTLCDDEHDFKQVLISLKQEMGSGEINLQTLGKILWEMGRFDLAERYFIRLLNELLPNDPLRISLYKDLGKLASQRGDLDMSMQWRQKSLELENQNQLPHNPNQIKLQNRWKQCAITVAGEIKYGNQLNQLDRPEGIFIDNDKTIYIVDWGNHRIVRWKCNAEQGQVIVGGKGKGNQNDQLNYPSDIILDKQNNSLIICDNENRRLIRWSTHNKANPQILISDIDCWGVTMDKNGFIYVSNTEKNEVRRWKQGDKRGSIVAGGNGKGDRLNQLNSPTFIYIDEDYSLYVSDRDNHRVMKWRKDAQEGIIVAGGNSQGNSLAQLSSPHGVIVDHSGQIYIADRGNNRIMRWYEGDAKGSVVVGGNGEGRTSNELYQPSGLLFDVERNLYVSDFGNNRIQKFLIDLG